MSASATKTPTLATELFGAGVGFRWYSALRRACAGLLLGTAILLLVRRLAGALERPPSFLTALGVIAAATFFAALYRLALRRAPPRDEVPRHIRQSAAGIAFSEGAVQQEEFLRGLFPALPLTVIAGSLTLPEIGMPALAALWLTVVGGEALWIGTKLSRPPVDSRSVAVGANELRPDVAATAVSEPSSPTPDEPAVFAVPEPEADSADDAGVSQSWKRYRDVDGAEVVEGFARATFEAGSRQAVIHLSFCPPLERTPTLEAEPLDDVEVRLTSAVVLPYAARIDAKLAEPAEEELSLKVAIRVVVRAGESGAASNGVGL